MRGAIICIGLSLAALPSFAQDTSPQKPWTTSFGGGVAITSGNSDTRNYNLSFSTKYDPKTALLFKADALYLLGKANGQKQVDKATADTRAEYTFSPRTFTFGEVSYLRDPFKDISYSVAPVAGVGYRIIQTKAQTLAVDGAAGAIVENDVSVGRTTSGALKGGETFEWALSASSKITQKLTGIWKTRDFGDALYHFDAGLTTAIVTRVELKLAYTYDYKSKPAVAGIKKGDTALFAAVLLKF
jgi:putative salt-induced outer membrane protein YdiY